MIHFIGVDPGLSGAVAMLDEKGRFERVAPIPIMANNKATGRIKNCVNAKGLYDLLQEWVLFSMDSYIVTIEQVGSRPGDGAASAFSFGSTFGAIKAVCSCLSLPQRFVMPAVWKKHFKIEKDKEVARALALNTWPNASEYLKLKKDHDKAEALLIALYGKQKYE